MTVPVIYSYLKEMVSNTINVACTDALSNLESNTNRYM